MAAIIGRCAKCGTGIHQHREEMGIFFLPMDGAFEKHDFCPSCTDIIGEWIMDEEKGPIDAS